MRREQWIQWVALPVSNIDIGHRQTNKVKENFPDMLSNTYIHTHTHIHTGIRQKCTYILLMKRLMLFPFVIWWKPFLDFYLLFHDKRGKILHHETQNHKFPLNIFFFHHLFSAILYFRSKINKNVHRVYIRIAIKIKSNLKNHLEKTKKNANERERAKFNKLY